MNSDNLFASLSFVFRLLLYLSLAGALTILYRFHVFSYGTKQRRSTEEAENTHEPEIFISYTINRIIRAACPIFLIRTGIFPRYLPASPILSVLCSRGNDETNQLHIRDEISDASMITFCAGEKKKKNRSKVRYCFVEDYSRLKLRYRLFTIVQSVCDQLIVLYEFKMRENNFDLVVREEFQM